MLRLKSLAHYILPLNYYVSSVCYKGKEKKWQEDFAGLFVMWMPCSWSLACWTGENSSQIRIILKQKLYKYLHIYKDIIYLIVVVDIWNNFAFNLDLVNPVVQLVLSCMNYKWQTIIHRYSDSWNIFTVLKVFIALNLYVVSTLCN